MVLLIVPGSRSREGGHRDRECHVGQDSVNFWYRFHYSTLHSSTIVPEIETVILVNIFRLQAALLPPLLLLLHRDELDVGLLPDAKQGWSSHSVSWNCSVGSPTSLLWDCHYVQCLEWGLTS